MAEAIKGLVMRHQKVAFMLCNADKDTGIFTRMRKFTEMNKSSNSTEYNRKYVDRSGKDTDVTGYSPEYDYAFDQYVGDKVHNDLIDITENEKVGDDAIRTIVVVDLTTKTDEGKCNAKQRDYAVIPEKDGNDENTYTYSGNLKSKGEFKDIIVTSEDNWETCKVATTVGG